MQIECFTFKRRQRHFVAYEYDKVLFWVKEGDDFHPLILGAAC